MRRLLFLLVLVGCARSPEPIVIEVPRAEPPAPSPSVPPDLRALDVGPAAQLTWLPGDIAWQPGPDAFETGSELAVLEGDPADTGVFTLQLRLPDGFVIRPHWHPNVERVTVLSGTFLLGHGEEVDEEGATVLPAGSYVSLPKGMVHYAVSRGESIVQLTTVGPWEVVYVDPADDPRLREAARR